MSYESVRTCTVFGCVALAFLIAALPVRSQIASHIGQMEGRNLFHFRGEEDVSVFFTQSPEGETVPVQGFETDTYVTIAWSGETRLTIPKDEAGRVSTSNAPQFTVHTPSGRVDLPSEVTQTWAMMVGIHGRGSIAVGPDGKRIFISRNDTSGTMRVSAYDFEKATWEQFPVAGIVAGFEGDDLYVLTIDSQNERTLRRVAPPYDGPGTRLMELTTEAMSSRERLKLLNNGTMLAYPAEESWRSTMLRHLDTDQTVAVASPLENVFYDTNQDRLGFIVESNRVVYRDWQTLVEQYQTSADTTASGTSPEPVSTVAPTTLEHRRYEFPFLYEPPAVAQMHATLDSLAAAHLTSSQQSLFRMVSETVAQWSPEFFIELGGEWGNEIGWETPLPGGADSLGLIRIPYDQPDEESLVVRFNTSEPQEDDTDPGELPVSVTSRPIEISARGETIPRIEWTLTINSDTPVEQVHAFFGAASWLFR